MAGDYLFAAVGSNIAKGLGIESPFLIAPFAVSSRLDSSAVGGIVPVNKQDSQTISEVQSLASRDVSRPFSQSLIGAVELRRSRSA